MSMIPAHLLSLEVEVKRLKNLLAEAESKASATQALLLECQAVLEFYGCENNHHDKDTCDEFDCVVADKGARARKMLAKLGKLK